MEKQRPMVSVVCSTYNHIDYVRSALDGFVMQKCNFPIEVIVHDDASTDGTAEVVREYAERYPELITAILQTENQHSKGVSLLTTMCAKGTGKYMAICEGDDYWTDPLKLQKQVDALEAHPEVDICTACTALSADEKIVGKCAPSDKDTVFTPEEVILGGGEFVGTCSIVIRTDLMLTMPEYRKILSCDYTTQILGSLRGGMLYLSDCMSVYRTFAKGSWTASYHANRDRRVAFYGKVTAMLRKLDEVTEGKYFAAIDKRLKVLEYYHYNNEGEFRKMLSPHLREVYKEQSFKNKVKLRLRCMFPGLVKKFREKKFGVHK